MALNITTDDFIEMVVIRLDGRLVLGEETGAFRATVKKLLNEDRKVLVVSFQRVSLIDSGGLGALVAAQASARAAGASLRLCDLGPRSSELLQITKLYTVFDIYDSEQEAYRALH